nr:hypothetical protein [Prochloraceae cyanobacterium]
MGKKKRSVLAEVRRTDKKKEKTKVELNNFVFDEGEFKNELPESFNKAEERRKFARFHDTVLKMIVPTVPKRQ